MKTSIARFAYALFFACLSYFAPSAVWAEEVVVIVNKENPHLLDRKYITRIYTGVIRSWPDGSPVFPVDQSEDNEARTLFYATVIGKNQSTVRAMWQQVIFSGNGLPPAVASPDAAMKRIVATNRNAIGYILSSQMDASVKAIAR